MGRSQEDMTWRIGTSNMPGRYAHSPYCHICNVHYSDRKEHQKHMNMNHLGQSQLPFVCKCCQAGFYTPTGLRIHMIKHEGRIFRCGVCEASFKIESSVYRHMKTIHNMSQCKHCGTLYVLDSSNVHLCQNI